MEQPLGTINLQPISLFIRLDSHVILFYITPFICLSYIIESFCCYKHRVI